MAKFGVYNVAYPVVAVEIYNEGSTTVAIRQVTLAVQSETGGRRVGLDAFGEQTQKGHSTYESTWKLGPKDHVEYFMAFSEKGFEPNTLLAMPAEELRIVITCFSGTQVVVPGAEIQDVIRSMFNFKTS